MKTFKKNLGYLLSKQKSLLKKVSTVLCLMKINLYNKSGFHTILQNSITDLHSITICLFWKKQNNGKSKMHYWLKQFVSFFICGSSSLGYYFDFCIQKIVSWQFYKKKIVKKYYLQILCHGTFLIIFQKLKSIDF